VRFLNIFITLFNEEFFMKRKAHALHLKQKRNLYAAIASIKTVKEAEQFF